MESQYEIIVRTTSNLFQQYGVRSVSIDDVCKKLQISKKTFYIYFQQKEDLVDAVLTYLDKIHLEKFNKLLQNKNAIEAFLVILREIKKNVDSEPKLMWHDIEKYYPKVFERNDLKKRDFMIKGFEANLKQGIEEGYYREDLDVELISLFTSTQLRSFFNLMIQSKKKYTQKRWVEFFIDLTIHIIANEKGLKYMNENYTSTEINN
ncbi:MAG: TetR/AcrR family transcriptional regulator [Paludibacter sp.]